MIIFNSYVTNYRVKQTPHRWSKASKLESPSGDQTWLVGKSTIVTIWIVWWCSYWNPKFVDFQPRLMTPKKNPPVSKVNHQLKCLFLLHCRRRIIAGEKTRLHGSFPPPRSEWEFPFWIRKWLQNTKYPLVICCISMENHRLFIGYIHYFYGHFP